jgi:hypothetical protein
MSRFRSVSSWPAFGYAIHAMVLPCGFDHLANLAVELGLGSGEEEHRALV